MLSAYVVVVWLLEVPCFEGVLAASGSASEQASERSARENAVIRCIASSLSVTDGYRCLYTLRVAIAGGTAAARRAGPNTAICPSSHSTAAPTGR